MQQILARFGILAALALWLATAAHAQSPTPAPRALRVAIATDMAPHSVADDGGGLRGIRRDLWEAWSRTTGVPVRFILVPWAKTTDALAAGVADVADPVSFRSDQAAKFELSRSYTATPLHVFFNAELAGIHDVDSLRPYAVGVLAHGGCPIWLNERGITNLRAYSSAQALIKAALDHEIEVFCMGKFTAQIYLAQAGQLQRFRQTSALYSQNVHWAVASGNAALRDYIQEGFDRIPKAEVDSITQRWRGAVPDNPWLPELLRQAVWAGAAILLTFAGLAAWNWTLRRRVTAAVSELRAYGERFEALVDNLPGMVTRAFQAEDGRFELLYVSRASEHMPSADDGHGTRLSAEAFARLHSVGKTKGRVQVTTPAGSVAWQDRWATVVSRRDGGIEYETLVLDVTSEVEAKLALEQQERDRQLLERQIHEASKLEALGKLAGGIAHDFNNLLGGILGFASFVADDVGPHHPTQKFVTRISQACLRGRDLVDQILAFARQKKGEPTRFSLNALVAECRPLLDVATPSSIAITISPATAHTDLLADKGQVGQILMNLCFNARDAMESQTGTIAIGVDVIDSGDPLLSLSASAPPDAPTGAVPRLDSQGWNYVMVGRCDPLRRHAILSVRDSGSGMDAALMARAFEPFFTTKETGKGTGLGLSVVHGIVIAHDGAIMVRSRAGLGTEIKVLLPLAEGAPIEAALACADTHLDDAQRPYGRVLVVDDDGDFGDMLATMLERRGWSVSHHNDPRSALRALMAQPTAWTLMVTDQIMPHLRGQDLIARAKAIRPDLPCLLCTGYHDGFDEDQVTRLGISRLLRKPLEPQVLAAAIAEVVA
jgi:signal transduction histidine kinase/CheY-like chemotaxis protein